MQEDERLRIDTPEQIALELPLAGIGSRFLAVAVDTVLQALLYLAGFVALIASAPVLASLGSFVRLLGPALTVLFAFCVYWGYFAFFEIIWSGRTPGKRLAEIRVIKDSGRPITAVEAIGRNILRAIDFLPAMYGVGVVVMMLNRNSRRIGDFVAGTVVVHDRRTDTRPPQWKASGNVAVSHANLSGVTQEEQQLIETYLQRRIDLDGLVRADMAEQIARRIAARTGLQPEAGQPVDAFLEAVAQRVRDTARFR